MCLLAYLALPVFPASRMVPCGKSIVSLHSTLVSGLYQLMLALGGPYFSYQCSGANLSFLMTTGNHAGPSCKVLTVQRAAGALTNLEYGLRLDVPSNNTTYMGKEDVASKPTNSMILILDAIYHGSISEWQSIVISRSASRSRGLVSPSFRICNRNRTSASYHIAPSW